MKAKLREMKRKRDNLVARSRSAQAQAQLQDAARGLDIMDPASEVSRFEEKVRREEARVQSHEELAASSLDAQFAGLEDDDNRAEIENRLQALKAGRAVAKAGSRTRAPAR
jgi:phage shock protein A